MPELEIHHETEHITDPAGKRIGVLSAVLAVLLAIVSITSHRTHTQAIIEKASANDQWQHYQSTRLKYHNLELGERLTGVFGSGEAKSSALADLAAEKKKYDERGQEIQKQAQEADERAEAAEYRGLRFDIGEGLLEIGLVLSSLYFISRKKMFPVIGVIAGTAGVLVAITGFLLH